MKEDHIDHFDSYLFRSSYSCVFHSRNLSQSINPGPWKETTGLEIEGFPRQLYGNDCGIFMLMIDMPALRKTVVCHANGEFRPRKVRPPKC
ncbi:hypothetical protein NQZ68_030176 [Dissostichus eleginoides]|nr:hypothetical protein NQZ68_030176 [Dissostichus eleginoides]